MAIEAIANAIEMFAITPGRLSIEFERHAESMKRYIDQRSDRVDGKFDLVDNSSDLVDKKLNLVDDKFGLVDGKLDGVHGQFDRIESLMKTMIGWQIATVILIALTGLVGGLAVRLL